MKNFEKFLKEEVASCIEGKLGPLQFAYKAGKGVDDAKLFIPDRVCKHLETPKSFVRILFADFPQPLIRCSPTY